MDAINAKHSATLKLALNADRV